MSGPRRSHEKDVKRFWQRISPEPMSGCWLWLGSWDKQSYGQMQFGGRVQKAHRVSYEMHKGPIPQGLHIDHLCRNPYCVNPDHLEAVTQRVNTMRGISPIAVRFVAALCPNGHEYTAENTTHYKTGVRRCIQCTKGVNRRQWINRKKRWSEASRGRE